MITKQTLLDFMGRKRPIFYNDEALSKAVEISNDCAAEKSVTLNADVKTVSDGVYFNGEFFKGSKLSAHLKGCTSAVLFCATLGDGFDRAIERSKYESLELATLIDYAGLVMIEELCDKINLEISDAYNNKITSRYSIGFDDTSIKDQQKFLDLLNATKKIGVMTTAGDMMRPTKTVTAIVGIYD